MKPQAGLKPGEFYDSHYHSNVYSSMMENEDYYRGRSDVSRALYFPGSEAKRILEYGCGLGQNILSLPRAAGFEISREARAFCEKRGLRTYSKLSSVPRGKWDIVLCSHVLEHLENPLESLRLMLEFLAPGGKLFLVLPRDPQGPAGLSPDINQHLFTWNFRAINNLLNRAGWRVLTNETKYYQGFGLFLPLKKILGQSVYVSAVRILGRALNNGELFITAKPAGKGVKK
jgi:SAM-dependent methyltransferase